MNGLVPLVFLAISLLAILISHRNLVLGRRRQTVLPPIDTSATKRDPQTITEAENEIIFEVAREENPALEEYEGTMPLEEVEGESKDRTILLAFEALRTMKKDFVMACFSVTLAVLLIWRYWSARERNSEGYGWLGFTVAAWVSGPFFVQIYPPPLLH